MENIDAVTPEVEEDVITLVHLDGSVVPYAVISAKNGGRFLVHCKSDSKERVNWRENHKNIDRRIVGGCGLIFL